jgi:hypothetical protein
MKIATLFTICTACLLGGFCVSAQGTFQNLNFEAANLSGYQPGFVPTTSAFPDWQALIGASPASAVLYDDVSIGAPEIAIMDDKTGYVPIQGSYTAYLMSAVVGTVSTSVTLSQTGLVPTGTESIQLDANQAPYSSFVVTLGGDTINMVPLETFANYTLYGGNVSAWAGQDASLSITELPPASQEYSPSLLELDNIVFSTQSVPEPSPLALTGVGALLFALYRRFAPNRP